MLKKELVHIILVGMQGARQTNSLQANLSFGLGDLKQLVLRSVWRNHITSKLELTSENATFGDSLISVSL